MSRPKGRFRFVDRLYGSIALPEFVSMLVWCPAVMRLREVRAANIDSHLAGQGPYRTYTYGVSGYKRLLQRAGFQTARFYLALPDYRHPRFLIPTGDASFQYVLDNRLRSHPKVPAPLFMLASLGARLRLHEFLSPSFAIIARKTEN